MSGDDIARVGFYLLLLVVVGGAMLFELAGRGGRALRQLMLWAVIFAGLTLAADWWMGGTPRQQVMEDGARIQIPVGRGGHFHLQAELNGTPVSFIIDTGATSVALSRGDAERIGLDPDGLRYTGMAMTANGQVPTAPVTIRDFAIGEVRDRDVRAVVIDSDLQDSLLGMSYLRRFARVSFEGDLLMLER
ncbi:TIGR02281 family clan AA aspartic protease [Paracoccus aestuarii]|uniref:TIGR02281 family clan AA aspartic protease n=1 Tax=Paracoccus aestuarii TaxID=453842 RepID=A0A419A1X5_9RHOB|nr:TIGR02281 family clan AA aspartic protease [Paracoccus aestuarii]RJL07007.1 TIGR02281 family clan AA aspartic protease [Paracoccus aestuarii]WCR00524.1 TIGR02281 family clan AA aspartic protease [Paracoccus aestuarii]